MKYLMLLSVLFAFNVQAETTADDLALADEAIAAPTMNIEGQYQIKEEPKTQPEKAVQVEPKKVLKRLSQSDRLKLYRERLEERNRVMVEKKMEQIRYQTRTGTCSST